MHKDHSFSTEQATARRVRRATIGTWHLELLPRAPYEASYTPEQSIIGFTFDAQAGTHAFASDKKDPFCARPNGLACVPVGCDVYSQSSTGGEYLKILCSSEQERRWINESHFSDIISRSAINAAFSLRRALLSSDNMCPLQCEHELMVLESSVSKVLGASLEIENISRWMSIQRLKQVDDFIEAQLDTQLMVSDIAREFKLSTGYFSREFKKFVGRAPHQYIVDRRLEHARLLLHQQPLQDLSSIAFACGFASHSHMSEQFRVRLGISPSDLRK